MHRGPRTLELTGTVALVTGGSRGIGRAIAAALVDAGAAVTISARTAADVERAARELDAGRGRVLGVVGSVAQAAECERMVAGTVAAFGRLDVLVNNAGVGVFRPVAELSVEEWDRVLGTNLSGVFYCCRAAIPHLRAAGGGWIINIGSLAGKNPFPGGGAYNASKFGLVGFTEALMQEIRHDGIRVTGIMPGSVATGFGDHEPGAEDAWKTQPEDIAAIVLDLLATPARTLPSRIEVRPSRPPRK
jgi:3-oxoacyl-[acyl-carrier protein] reductase